MRCVIARLMMLVLIGHATAFAVKMPAEEAPKVAPGQVGEDSDYIIGPGDGIQIFVWREPELSDNITVRPDGKISARLVDDLEAVGRTPSELARMIEERLSEYVRSPQVSIIITNPQSVFSKITVIGQVASPQTLPYHKGMTAMDVALAVGGLTDFAKGNGAKIIRKDAKGKQQEIPVKLADIINKGRIEKDVPMKPGDVLIVPESRF